jgi:hypothetical protein
MIDFIPPEVPPAATEDKPPAYIFCKAAAAREDKPPAYFLCSSGSSTITTTSQAAAAAVPSADDIQNYAKEINAVFADGFQWSDIPAMIKISLQFLDQFFDLTVPQKRVYLAQILDTTIGKTEVRFLPTSFSHEVFTLLANHLANILVPDSVDIYFPTESIYGQPDDAAITQAVDTIIRDFKGGFQWKYVTYMVEMAVKFGNQFEDLTTAERVDITKNLIDLIISKVDVPFIPDCIADPILDMIADSLVDEVFAIL